MSKLAGVVLGAIEKYDEVLANTTGTAACQADDAEVAAHECVAEIRAVLEAEPEAENEVNLNNPIAKLQERAQAKHAEMPHYHFDRIGGLDHVPKMTCVCTSEGIEGRGSGPNKQTAKRRAARAVLEIMLRYGHVPKKDGADG